jgi:hypothetical protein
MLDHSGFVQRICMSKSMSAFNEFKKDASKEFDMKAVAQRKLCYESCWFRLRC